LSTGSLFKHSYLGSFYLPPLPAKESSISKDTKLPKVHFQACPPKPDAHSKGKLCQLMILDFWVQVLELNLLMSYAFNEYMNTFGIITITPTAVIAALKSLQEKMRRLELEKVQAEQNVRQVSEATQQDRRSSDLERNSPAKEADTTSSESSPAIACQLQSAEARCALLEKQLDYMRKMLEAAELDKTSIAEKQAALHSERLKNQADISTKLQKLELECLKFTSSQSEATKKIELLEQKLHEEEQERKLVQEKTAELEKGLEEDLLLCPSVPADGQGRKKTTKAVRKAATMRSVSLGSPHVSRAKQPPFVAGTSTSPSHSVHANIQSVLHMMKHRGPQTWGQSHTHPKPVAKLSTGPCGVLSSSQGAPALDSLSDLLLALQDELEEMSLDHQELKKQIEETHKRRLREDLERELDCLVHRMEEKGVQISQLRKHQLAVEKLKEKGQKARRRCINSKLGDEKKTMLSPQQRNRITSRPQCPGYQDSKCGLGGIQKLQTHLKRDDVQWEA
ncbi:centrosomal protein CEP57L1 isoform X2, partial [Arapaima gigas]